MKTVIFMPTASFMTIFKDYIAVFLRADYFLLYFIFSL